MSVSWPAAFTLAKEALLKRNGGAMLSVFDAILLLLVMLCRFVLSRVVFCMSPE